MHYLLKGGKTFGTSPEVPEDLEPTLWICGYVVIIHLEIGDLDHIWETGSSCAAAQN